MGNQDALREAARPWGQRVKQLNLPPLEQLADMFLPSIPLALHTGYAYAFIPRDFLQGLLGVFGMDLPTEFTKPDFSVVDKADAIPSSINSSAISYISEFLPAP